MLVQHMIEEQERQLQALEAHTAQLLADGSEASGEQPQEGVKQQDLMTWYLNEQQSRWALLPTHRCL
jgi:hypothetical protein